MTGISYTIIGGEKQNNTPHTIPWTLLVLNRGRSAVQVSHLKFAEVISIESSTHRRHETVPNVKTLITDTSVNPGEQ